MVGNITGKPYKIIEQSNKYQIREFNNFNPIDLYWHRDKEDRCIELIEGVIKLQLDNELPITLIKGKEYFIPKETFHRVIAKDNFKIKIYFK